MSDNLLKQAIADAKQVKQLASEAARMQLEEAFKPHLAQMISSHLRNESSLNEDNDATSAIGGGAVTVKNPGPKMPSAATRDSSHIENPGQEVEDIFDQGTKPLKEEDGGDGTQHNGLDFGGTTALKEAIPGEEEVDINIDPSGAPGGAPSGLGGGAPAPVAGGVPGGLGGAPAGIPGADPLAGGQQMGLGAGSPDELDLEAIIRELELDSQGDMGLEEPQLGASPSQAAPAEPKIESFSDPMAGKKVTGPLDGSNIQETLSGDGDEGVHRDGQALKAVDGVNGGKKVSPGQAVTASKADRMSESEEIDLDEILREMEMSEEQTVAESKKLATENAALKNSLREHREVVLYLKSKLSEVNVLNAKLLFTNKLFKNFDLKLEQKMSIVESFDRAQSVREVKIVYTTLAETYKGKFGTGSTKTAAKNITEGMSSKSVGSTAPKSASILEEGNMQVSRMQKLAGIIKK